MKPRLRMNARPTLLVVEAALALALAGALIGLATLVPSLISVLAVVLLTAALAAASAVEIAVWVSRGVRSVEIDSDTLVLYRGASLRPRRIARSSVIMVRTVRRFGRQVALVRPRGERTIRIPEDAFPREEFLSFVGALESWRRA